MGRDDFLPKKLEQIRFHIYGVLFGVGYHDPCISHEEKENILILI